MESLRPDLTLPGIDSVIRRTGERDAILCLIRKKYVALTPEEWVRQHVLHYLVRHRGYPASLIAVERGFEYQGMPWRADIVAHDRRGKPLLLVECKAPQIALRQEVFEQVSRYNLVVGARYAAVSNGLEHYCFMLDRETRAISFLADIPAFEIAT